MMLVQLVTLEKVVWQGEADSLSISTSLGQIEILPHHVNMVSVVEAGELIIHGNKQVHKFFVTEGSLEVRNNEVTVLADLATLADNLTESRIEEAKIAAKKAKEEHVDAMDFTLLEANLKRELAKDKIIQKYHHKTDR
jgi:F-type H+-transporting ATPase subunit epsilon